MSCTMFVADFATQFQKTLGVKPVLYQELNAAVNAAGVLDGRDVLWDLYEGLMRFLLNVRPPFASYTFTPRTAVSLSWLSLAQ